MTKTKTARLSLTMPGASEDQTSQAIKPAKENQQQPKPTAPTGLRRPEGRHQDKAGPLETYEQDPVSSRSISPSAPFSAASEQSRSPTSPTSPAITSLPPYPPSPELNSKHNREQSRSFFQNLKASKSSVKIQPADTTSNKTTAKAQPSEPTIRKVPSDNESEDEMRWNIKTKSTPDLRGASGNEPVPEMPRLDRDAISQRSVDSKDTFHTIPRRPVGNISTSKSNLSSTQNAPPSPAVESHESRKNGKLWNNIMKRAHSGRPEDHGSMAKPGTPPNASKSPEPTTMKPPSRDRSASRHNEEEVTAHHHITKPHLKDQRSQSFRDGPGSNLFKAFKTQGARAAKEVGKAGKGFFRNRMAANSAPPPDPATYVLKVINLPLVEQTRITRLAKRLEDSKDKTEFWMPALPWRCIDFLNFTGCETEGLYRVPGSEREVRAFKAKFDRDHDINLFEEEELYDVNTVGSLFKSWLRDLPDDVFPQELQNNLSKKYTSVEKAPEELKDVLSQLPPWNYYLLFAITCHLSLLHAYKDKNKMTFQNLYICFAPALRINGDCFRWLVGDWRSCWKGCTTEKEYLEAEYRLIEGDDFDSDMSSQNTKIEDDAEPTPKAGTFQTQYETQHITHHNSQNDHRHVPLQPPPKGRFDSESAIDDASSTASHSREGSRHTVSREGDDRPSSKHRRQPQQQFQQQATGHVRKASQLPELNFGKPISPISPTFAHK